MKSLAKNVDDRYQSAAAMKADIDRYLAGKPVQAPAVVPVGRPRGFIPPRHRRPSRPACRDADDEPEKKRRGPLDPAAARCSLALIVAALILGPKLFKAAPDAAAGADASPG